MSSANRLLNIKKLKTFLDGALKEDIATGDITSQLLIPKNIIVKARMILKEDACIAGLTVAEAVFRLKDKTVYFKPYFCDGSFLKKGAVIAQIKGNARAILACERTALNILSRLSGIATATARFVQKVRPYKAVIMDTRKTTPGLRLLEKYAVTCGGGRNHRLGLWDGILIKDNHLAIKPLEENLRLIRKLPNKALRQMKVEVEVKNITEFHHAAAADIIMLDNMSTGQLKRCAKAVKKLSGKKPLLEVSGGITINNVRAKAAAGADIISIGSLTHSPKTIDISLEICPGK